MQLAVFLPCVLDSTDPLDCQGVFAPSELARIGLHDPLGNLDDLVKKCRLPEAPLVAWGVAQIEQDYDEDLIRWRALRSESDELRETLAVEINTQPYQGNQICTLFETLPRLLGYIRRHFTVDTLLYWGQVEAGYFPMGVYALISDRATASANIDRPYRPPYRPVEALHTDRPYAYLSAQLIEAAGVEWVLRSLPETLTDSFEDPRPIVTLGGQPYYQTRVSRHVLSDLKPRTLLANTANLRALWETFLIPHQQVTGYVSQWQEILYRSLPLYCQLSEILRDQAQTLNDKEILTPFFQLRVTPQGRIRQDIEGLRENAQLLQARHEEPLTPRQLLRVPDFRRRWQLFLHDHGHWGSLDLSAPRLHACSDLWLRSLLTPWHTGYLSDHLAWQQQLWSSVFWKRFQKLYLAREQFWSDALWAFDQVQRRLHEKLSAPELRAGYDTENFFDYGPEEWPVSQEAVAPCDENEAVSESFVLSFEVSVPDQLQGQGLHTGGARGRIWKPLLNALRGDLQEALAQMTPPERPQDTILCLDELSVLHWPWVAQCAGVLLSGGDPLGHQSHLLREWNIPAIVQVSGLSAWPEGTWVRLDSYAGKVYRIAEDLKEADGETDDAELADETLR